MSDASAMPALGASLSLLTAAMVLATASALAAAVVLRWVPGWLRMALVFGVKAVALFPIASLVWAFVGFWLSRLGWPVESLMPVPESAAWQWVLPVILLAVPLTAELTAFLLRKPRHPATAKLTTKGLNRTQAFYHHELPRLWLQMGLKLQGLCLLGAAYLIVIEDILDLPGAAAALANALRTGQSDTIGSALLLWGAVAACSCLIIGALHRASRPSLREKKPRSETSLLIEGAVAIGLSRAAAWRRHALPRQIRQTLALLFAASSWAVVVTILISVTIGRGPGAALAGAAQLALDDPRAPLLAGIAPALCALFLWLLSRILAPRPNPEAHG